MNRFKTLALILTACFLTSCSESSEKPVGQESEKSQMEEQMSTSLVRTTLIVPELEPAFALYRDLLGFKLVYNQPYSGNTFRKLFNLDPEARVDFAILRNPDNEGASIGLLSIDLDQEEPVPLDEYHPYTGEAILFMVTTRLDEIYARISEANSSIVTVVAPPFETNGGREMVISDANGVRMYVFQAE